jgi:hypothetical protein
MNKNEKAEALESDGLKTNLLGLTNKPNQTNSKEKRFVMTNHKPNRNKFQYHCSFCACELHDDGLRFNGVGACPSCDDLAHLWVKSLREHAANYFNNLGVKK